MKTNLRPPDADRTAATESAIDWSVPIDDSAYHLAPEYLPLFGTPIWEAMTPAQRIAYSRHEAAAFYRTVAWLENILIHCFMKYAYFLPAQDPLYNFIYLEAAEECRHSAMFGEFVRHANVPGYAPPARVQYLGKLIKLLGIRVVYLMAVLCGEVIVDGCNSATSHGEGIHPVSKQVAKLHIVDEAQHIVFARQHIPELWAAQDAKRRWCARWNMPIAVYTIVDAMVNPQVYESLGIKDGYKTAWNNPNRRKRVIRDLAGYIQFLRELGVITPSYVPVWRALGLMA